MSETNTNSGLLVTKDGALAGAAVSAAVSIGVYALRKALAESGRELSLGSEDRDAENGRSLLSTAWDSASDALVPLAEEAAEAAGRWAATKSPALIKDRLLPRFIGSFEAAA